MTNSISGSAASNGMLSIRMASSASSNAPTAHPQALLQDRHATAREALHNALDEVLSAQRIDQRQALVDPRGASINPAQRRARPD